MQPVDRLHALDAVRAYALLLGVVLHSVAAFLQDFPIPIWLDEPSTTAAVIYYVIHMLRMSSFFLIAGFFGRMVIERRGIKAFVKDRAKRIALPLFVGGPFVMVSIGIGLVLGTLPYGLESLQSMMQQQPPQPAATTNSVVINTAHLWFLYYLLIFYILTLTLRAIVHAIDTNRSIATICDRVLSFIMRGVWGPVLIALPIAVYFSQLESWNEWIGLPAPFTLVPQMDAIVGYGVPFALGWLLHRQIPLLLDLQRSWLIYFVLAVVLTVVCLTMVGPEPIWQGPNLVGTERMIYTAAYMTGIWCWVFALIGAAVKFLSDEHPLNRYLADASYWIYLLHMTTIIFFIALIRPFDWHWGIKFVIIWGGSMGILLLSYHYLVRFTWIGAILNGRRHPRPGKSPPADAVPATT